MRLEQPHKLRNEPDELAVDRPELVSHMARGRLVDERGSLGEELLSPSEGLRWHYRAQGSY